MLNGMIVAGVLGQERGEEIHALWIDLSLPTKARRSTPVPAAVGGLAMLVRNQNFLVVAQVAILVGWQEPTPPTLPAVLAGQLPISALEGLVVVHPQLFRL